MAGVALSLCTLFFLVWLSANVLDGKTALFDDRVRSAVHRHSTPELTLLMRALTFLGSPPVLWPLVGLAAFLFQQAGWRREAVLMSITMLGSLGLETGLKSAFHRPRPAPFFGLAAPESYSYPSGHALFSLCFYGALAWLTAIHARGRPARFFIWTAAALLTILIGFSRIYLGVHYPSDVIAGYGVAFLWMTLVTTGSQLRRGRS